MWWGGTAKQADRQGGREGGEQTLRPAHTVGQLNKSLSSSERYGEKGKGKMSDFLAANDEKRTKSSKET